SDVAGDLFLTYDSAGDQIKIEGGLSPDRGVDEFIFSDGTTATRQQLAAIVDTGSPTNTRLYGGSGADTLDANGYATYAQGGGGADTFIYKAGYGALEIKEDASVFTNSAATVQFGPGLTASNMQVSSDASGNMYLADG